MKTPGLIRSGWWVLVAAAALSALMAWTFFRVTTTSRIDEEKVVIELEPCRVEPDRLIVAMARDSLVALTMPATLTPDEVDLRNQEERGKLLVSSDRVIGVNMGGETRAYPLRLLRWHEVVNDRVGGRAIAVTYSPLSGAVAVWDRRLRGVEIEFGVSGRLFNSNTLLYDRRADGGPSSLWHQLSGQALAGPAVGENLSPLSAEIETWAEWRRRHPSTRVMAPDSDSKQLYKRDPYHSYRGSDALRFPVSPLPPGDALALKDLVAVATVGGTDHAFALRDLGEAVGAPRGSWAALLDDVVYMISFDAEAGTFRIAAHERDLAPPPVRFAYWFEWYSLNPETVPLP